MPRLGREAISLVGQALGAVIKNACTTTPRSTHNPASRRQTSPIWHVRHREVRREKYQESRADASPPDTTRGHRSAVRVVAELHPFRRSVRELVPRGGGRRGVLLQPGELGELAATAHDRTTRRPESRGCRSLVTPTPRTNTQSHHSPRAALHFCSHSPRAAANYGRRVSSQRLAPRDRRPALPVSHGEVGSRAPSNDAKRQGGAGCLRAGPPLHSLFITRRGGASRGFMAQAPSDIETIHGSHGKLAGWSACARPPARHRHTTNRHDALTDRLPRQVQSQSNSSAATATR